MPSLAGTAEHRDRTAELRSCGAAADPDLVKVANDLPAVEERGRCAVLGPDNADINSWFPVLTGSSHVPVRDGRRNCRVTHTSYGWRTARCLVSWPGRAVPTPSGLVVAVRSETAGQESSVDRASKDIINFAGKACTMC